jgi:hypothetical protein
LFDFATSFVIELSRAEPAAPQQQSFAALYTLFAGTDQIIGQPSCAAITASISNIKPMVSLRAGERD